MILCVGCPQSRRTRDAGDGFTHRALWFALQLELQMLVRTGFTPAQALRSATLWSAEAVGVGNDLGSLERGKLADLAIVAGDPLQNIA